MTREELEKKAREYLAEHSEYSEVFGQTFVAVDTLTAMVDFAEPREKRIAELEAQIEKMKQELDTAREEANRQEQWELYSVLNDIYNDNFEVITSVSN